MLCALCSQPPVQIEEEDFRHKNTKALNSTKNLVRFCVLVH
jgi:hypothetical protein